MNFVRILLYRIVEQACAVENWRQILAQPVTKNNFWQTVYLYEP